MQPQKRSSLGILLGAAFFFVACRDGERTKPSSGLAQHLTQELAPPPPSPSPGPPPSPPAPTEGTRLLELDLPAYGQVLGIEGDESLLLTSAAAYRLSPQAPPRKLELDLGLAPALTPSGIFFWSNGALWRAPTSGGKPMRLARVAGQPQTVLASGAHVAWLGRTDESHLAISLLERSRVRTGYVTSQAIDSIAMMGEAVFFTERQTDGSWRFGRVGGARPVLFSELRHGRTPAMLVPADGWLYYYDGTTFQVRRVSPDLQREDTLLSDLVCSPLAVATELYCSSVEGLYAIALQGGARRLLIAGSEHQMTALAAAPGRISWLSDRGPNKLAVETLRVP